MLPLAASESYPKSSFSINIEVALGSERTEMICSFKFCLLKTNLPECELEQCSGEHSRGAIALRCNAASFLEQFSKKFRDFIGKPSNRRREYFTPFVQCLLKGIIWMRLPFYIVNHKSLAARAPCTAQFLGERENLILNVFL